MKVRVRDITDYAASLTHLPQIKIRHGSRRKMYVRARWGIIVCGVEQGHSYSSIARSLGGYDHTTIMYGFHMAHRLAETDPSFNRYLTRLRNYVASHKPPQLPFGSEDQSDCQLAA